MNASKRYQDDKTIFDDDKFLFQLFEPTKANIA